MCKNFLPFRFTYTNVVSNVHKFTEILKMVMHDLEDQLRKNDKFAELRHKRWAKVWSSDTDSIFLLQPIQSVDWSIN